MLRVNLLPQKRKRKKSLFENYGLDDLDPMVLFLGILLVILIVWAAVVVIVQSDPHRQPIGSEYCEIHCTESVDSATTRTSVPGGWLYTRGDSTMFVPDCGASHISRHPGDCE